jgi:hypothetical protein
MKSSLGLYITFCFMYFIIAVNILVLDGKWNGITFWLCTVLFLIGIGFHVASRSKNKK